MTVDRAPFFSFFQQQSSLSLQIILYLHGLFLRVWIFATLILLAWKRLVLKFVMSSSSMNLPIKTLY